MSLTLYYHPLASYCHKVLIALYENGIDFDKRLIDLGQEAERAELRALWPVGKFPVIRDETRQRDVAESTIIVEYLDQYFPGDRGLIPDNRDDALEVRLWDRVFDNYVQGPMQQIVGDRIGGSQGDMSQPRAMLDTAYAMIDRHMDARTWISDYGFSMADCSSAPALFYASIVHPIPPALQHLGAYFEQLMQRPSVQRVIDEARPYFVHFPFVDAMPERFLRDR